MDHGRAPHTRGGFIALNPQRLYGIFGLGDIVFDPTSYGEIIEVWNQDVSNGVKLAQTYNEAVKIVKNGIDTYNLAVQMARGFRTNKSGKQRLLR